MKFNTTWESDIKKALLFLLLILTLQLQAMDSAPKPFQNNASSDLHWIRLGGPPGGTGYDIRYNFDNPNIWYVTDAHGGVHISTDNGVTWQASNSGIPGQSGTTGDAIGVFCLTVDPNNPQIIWAGTIDSGHIFRSIDGGLTWEERDNGISIKYDLLTFRGITVDPYSSDIVYVMAETTSESATEQGQGTWKSGTGGIVYKTTDSGARIGRLFGRVLCLQAWRATYGLIRAILMCSMFRLEFLIEAPRAITTPSMIPLADWAF